MEDVWGRSESETHQVAKDNGAGLQEPGEEA